MFQPEFSYEATTLDYLSPQWYPFREGGPDSPLVQFGTKVEAEAFVAEWFESREDKMVATRVRDVTPKTDEFLEAEFAANRAYWAGRAEAERAREAARPAKGKDVEVVRGRKVPIGTKGFVIWEGEGQWGSRVGIKQANGEVVFTAASNVAVVAA